MTATTSAPARTLDGLGRPLTDLRVSVTDRCNFRCAYCLPPDGPSPSFLGRSELLTFEQLRDVVAATAGLGVRTVRLTGGEPLVRRGLPDLVSMIAAVPGVEDVALTTNGWFLADQAAALAAAGLTRVTISLDTLDPADFARLTGVGASVSRVVAGVRAAREAGLRPVKLNCVLRRGHNEDAVLPLVRFARAEGAVLRFIEFMDVGPAGHWRPRDVVPAGEVLSAVAAQFPVLPLDHRPGEVATRYRYADGGGELGVITAVSAPFCADCSRLRLTADGRLWTCLFARSGTDLRPLFAEADPVEALRRAVASLWAARTERTSQLRAQGRVRRGGGAMHHLGG